MYCSTCGVAVAHELAYCNHCGAQVIGASGKALEKPTELFPESLVWAILTVFVVGVGTPIGLIAVMKNYGMNDAVTMGFAAVIFTIMLAIEGVFIGLLFSRRDRAKPKSNADTLAGRRDVKGKQQTTNELGAADPRALPEPVASVTEHTTRTFEPIYRGAKHRIDD